MLPLVAPKTHHTELIKRKWYEATLCLVRNDPKLRELNTWYREWADDRHLHHLVLREHYPVRIFFTVVKPDSADPALHRVRAWPTDTNHISIAKPRNREDEVYEYVREFIRDPFEHPVPIVEQKIETVIEAQRAIKDDTAATKDNTEELLRRLEEARKAPDIAVKIGEDFFEVVFPGSEPVPADPEIVWHDLSDAVDTN